MSTLTGAAYVALAIALLLTATAGWMQMQGKPIPVWLKFFAFLSWPLAAILLAFRRPSLDNDEPEGPTSPQLDPEPSHVLHDAEAASQAAQEHVGNMTDDQVAAEGAALFGKPKEPVP